MVFAIADELTNIAPALGAQHTIVLPILENLCAHDETVIRDRAVKSLTKIMEKYTDNEINNFILPLVMSIIILCRLLNWLPIRPISPAGSQLRIWSAMCIHGQAPTNKNYDSISIPKYRKFLDISNEEMLLLQRVTAMKIPQLCKVYEKEFLLQDLISMLKNRSTDEQDQIRVLATESFKEVAKFLNRD